MGISISGRLLMPDNVTPHVACTVQAVTPAKEDGGEPTVVATTLSNDRGHYQFVNLMAGRYQARCYTRKGYTYYGAGKILHIETDNVLSNIDFRMMPFKRGRWENYTVLDGLAGAWVTAICEDLDGMMWFGTYGGGVSRYDGERFETLTTDDGLASLMVISIYREPTGPIWFGTLDGGVS